MSAVRDVTASFLPHIMFCSLYIEPVPVVPTSNRHIHRRAATQRVSRLCERLAARDTWDLPVSAPAFINAIMAPYIPNATHHLPDPSICKTERVPGAGFFYRHLRSAGLLPFCNNAIPLLHNYLLLLFLLFITSSSKSASEY